MKELFFQIAKAKFMFSAFFSPLYYFGADAGVRTQGFVLARQALYHLTHGPSPFCLIYFSDRLSLNILSFFFFSD
jgi:hypothetical protein